MKCLTKIHHRYLIYSFFAVAFCFCLSVFGFVSNSYAITSDCVISFSGNGSGSSTSISSVCPDFSNAIFYRFKSVNVTFSTSSSGTSLTRFRVFINNATYSLQLPVFDYRDISMSFSNSSPLIFPVTDGFPIVLSNIRYGYNDNNVIIPPNLVVYFEAYSASISGSITLEYSSSYSDFLGGSSEPCPEVTPCPPIPENPYDDKLDEIKKAIYCASAVMIMIYFFFIVYKIIVKDGGRR